MNEKGVALAKMTGKALMDVPFYCCFTSPLKRARETARLVLNGREVPVYPDERIQEISFGDWEGRESVLLPPSMLDNFFHHTERYQAPEGGEELSQICARTKAFWEEDWEGRESVLLPPSMLDNFFHHTERYQAPEGGEELSQICARTKAFWEDITSREELQDKTILIASHGCAVRALLQNVYEDASIENFWHGKVPPNCGVNIVEVRENKAILLRKLLARKSSSKLWSQYRRSAGEQSYTSRRRCGILLKEKNRCLDVTKVCPGTCFLQTSLFLIVF